MLNRLYNCGLGDIERNKVAFKTTFSMKTSDKEKLWSISTQDGRAKVLRNNVPLRSSNNGQEYGFLLGVEVKVQSDKKMIQLEFESGSSSREQLQNEGIILHKMLMLLHLRQRNDALNLILHKRSMLLVVCISHHARQRNQVLM